jgi:hypothetical protein
MPLLRLRFGSFFLFGSSWCWLPAGEDQETERSEQKSGTNISCHNVTSNFGFIGNASLHFHNTIRSPGLVVEFGARAS